METQRVPLAFPFISPHIFSFHCHLSHFPSISHPSSTSFLFLLLPAHVTSPWSHLFWHFCLFFKLAHKAWPKPLFISLRSVSDSRSTLNTLGSLLGVLGVGWWWWRWWWCVGGCLLLEIRRASNWISTREWEMLIPWTLSVVHAVNIDYRLKAIKLMEQKPADLCQNHPGTDEQNGGLGYQLKSWPTAKARHNSLNRK